MRRIVNRILHHRWGNKENRFGKRGQSTAEYIIIVALIAIGSIALISIFGNQIRELFLSSSEQLSGNNAATTGNALTNGNTNAQKRIGTF